MADYAVIDPATGQTVKEYPTITDHDLLTAIGRAASAHRPWAERSIAARAACIHKVADLHIQRAEALAAIISREMGKPREQALGEVEFSAEIYKYYADRAEQLLADEPIELLGGEGSALIRRASLGTLLGIMPWNYPYYQVARFAGPNLVIGNTILLKHAPQCPESSAAMESMFHQAGIPTDAYINIYATNEQISTVIADPRVRGISLTGSGRAGAAVAEQAGRHLKKVVLELGGSDPFILLSTDDLDAVVTAAINARMSNAGQSCNAAKRFLVIDSLYDEFLAKFTAAMESQRSGSPDGTATDFGPLSSSTATERLESQVQAATAAGATVITGGSREGNFFTPTVLTDIKADNPIRLEEFFGPVAQVYKISSEDEAIEIANSTSYGLGSYVFTTDPEQAERIANRIDAGMVYINIVDADGVELPFGGVKASGFGRELGRYGADEFVNKKLIRAGA